MAGNGNVFGHFVQERINERHADMLADGTPLRIDFGTNLLRLDDDAQAHAGT